MGKDSKAGHAFDLADQIHTSVGDADSGACLTRHALPWAKVQPQFSLPPEKRKLIRDSCNHRWQARLQALDDKAWYDYPAYISLTMVDRVGVEAASANRANRWAGNPYATQSGGRWFKTAPREGDWDIGGNDPDEKNFGARSQVPYLHQAHHLIPNELFNGQIRKTADQLPDPTAAFALIRRGLATAKYNLNHKLNMIVLPMDRRIAMAIRLPVHTHVPNHKLYDAKVELKLAKPMAEFAKAVRKALEEECEEPKVTLSKTQLVNVSKGLRTDVRNFGLAQPGRALDAMG